MKMLQDECYFNPHFAHEEIKGRQESRITEIPVFLAADSRSHSGELKERSCSSKCSLGSSEFLGGPEDQPQSWETQPHPRPKISPLTHCAQTRRLPQGDWTQDGCQCTAGCLHRHTCQRQSSLQWELFPHAAFLQTGASHRCTHKPSLSPTNKKAVKVASTLGRRKSQVITRDVLKGAGKLENVATLHKHS